MEPTNQNIQPSSQSLSQTQVPVQQGSSFGETPFQDPRNSFGGKLQRFWQALRYYFMQIWPYLRQLINFVVYQTIKVVKAVVRIGLTQTGIIKD